MASDNSTMPPWYRNGEYWFVRQISSRDPQQPDRPGRVEDPAGVPR